MLGKCDFNRDPRFYVVKDPTSGDGQGANSRIAQANNNTFRANNGVHRDRPYGSSGYTYSTGKQLEKKNPHFVSVDFFLSIFFCVFLITSSILFLTIQT